MTKLNAIYYNEHTNTEVTCKYLEDGSIHLYERKKGNEEWTDYSDCAFDGVDINNLKIGDIIKLSKLINDYTYQNDGLFNDGTAGSLADIFPIGGDYSGDKLFIDVAYEVVDNYTEEELDEMDESEQMDLLVRITGINIL